MITKSIVNSTYLWASHCGKLVEQAESSSKPDLLINLLIKEYNKAWDTYQQARTEYESWYGEYDGEI